MHLALAVSVDLPWHFLLVAQIENAKFYHLSTYVRRSFVVSSVLGRALVVCHEDKERNTTQHVGR